MEFILNDEGLNTYGWRVLTNGILLGRFEKNPVMLWNHDAGDGWDEDANAHEKVLGKWTKLRIEDRKLIGTPVFDEESPIARALKAKVEAGIVSATSLRIERRKTSDDPNDLLYGQTLPTVTECELIEVSFVTIPANPNTTRLSRLSYFSNDDKFNGKWEKLSQHSDNQPTPPQQPIMKNALLKLGLHEQSTEQEAVNKISELNTKALNYDTLSAQLNARNEELKTAKSEVEQLKKAQNDAKIEAVLNEALKNGQITEGVKSIYQLSLQQDFEPNKKLIEGLPKFVSPTAQIAAVNATKQLNVNSPVDKLKAKQLWTKRQKENPGVPPIALAHAWHAENPNELEQVYELVMGAPYEPNTEN